MGRQADDGDWGLDMLEGPLSKSKVLSLSLFFISPTGGKDDPFDLSIFSFFLSSFLPSFSLPTSMPNPVCLNCSVQNDTITYEGPEGPGKKRQAKQVVCTSRLLPTLPFSLLEQWKSPSLFLDLPAVAGGGNSPLYPCRYIRIFTCRTTPNVISISGLIRHCNALGLPVRRSEK